MSIKCSCNTWNPNDAIFCRNCGAKLKCDRKEKDDKNISANRQSNSKCSESKKAVFGLTLGQFIAVLFIIGGAIWLIVEISDTGFARNKLAAMGFCAWISTVYKSWYSL